jgi:hypothetical protein
LVLLPRFDSPSVFASLLGRDKGGRWEAMKRFIPESERLHPDDWIGTNEEIDELTVFDQARALEENLPSIPMTYLASNEPLPDPKEDAAWRKLLGVSSTGSHRDG